MVVLLPSPTSACSVSLSVSLSGSVGSTYDLLQVYTSVHIRHRAGADRHHPKLDWHGWAFSVPSLASSRTCAFETRLDSPRPTLPLPPPPCFDVCTLLSPAALCSLLSHVGARPVAASHLRRTPLVLRASPKNMLCSGGIGAGLGQVWVRCFNVRRLAFEGRRSWGRTRSSPFFPLRAFPCLLSPPPTPTLYASATHHLATPQLGRGRAWSVLGSVSIRAPPAAWQACAPWGADLEASLPCCRCRLRFDAVWPSTVEVLPIR
jgi:hypothetical protein